MSLDNPVSSTHPISIAINDAVAAREAIQEALNQIDQKIAHAMRNPYDQQSMLDMRDSFTKVVTPAKDGFYAGHRANLAVLALNKAPAPV